MASFPALIAPEFAARGVRVSIIPPCPPLQGRALTAVQNRFQPRAIKIRLIEPELGHDVASAMIVQQITGADA